MTTLAPARTNPQRMAALARANAIRVYRAEVKRNLRAGADPLAMLESLAPELATMKVEQFLMALPKFGRFKVATFMRRHRISSAKTLGGMSDRQRAELVEALAR